MSEALLLPPHDAWTLADLIRVPDDGCRYEIFDGSLLVSPPPSVRHQAVAQVLSRLLEAAAGAQVRVLQAAGIATSGQDEALKYVIPDVLVVSADAVRDDAQALDPRDVLAVIEIVSPSTVTRDQVLKRAVYAGLGIGSYWLVDTTGQGSITVLELDAAARLYREVQVAVGPDMVRVARPFAFEVSPSALLS